MCGDKDARARVFARKHARSLYQARVAAPRPRGAPVHAPASEGVAVRVVRVARGRAVGRGLHGILPALLWMGDRVGDRRQPAKPAAPASRVGDRYWSRSVLVLTAGRPPPSDRRQPAKPAAPVSRVGDRYWSRSVFALTAGRLPPSERGPPFRIDAPSRIRSNAPPGREGERGIRPPVPAAGPRFRSLTHHVDPEDAREEAGRAVPSHPRRLSSGSPGAEVGFARSTDARPDEIAGGGWPS